MVPGCVILGVLGCGVLQLILCLFAIHIACAPGMYRSELDLTCQLCPLNSESQYAASAECPCLHGYFRASFEGANSACTG